MLALKNKIEKKKDFLKFYFQLTGLVAAELVETRCDGTVLFKIDDAGFVGDKEGRVLAGAGNGAVFDKDEVPSVFGLEGPEVVVAVDGLVIGALKEIRKIVVKLKKLMKPFEATLRLETLLPKVYAQLWLC